MMAEAIGRSGELAIRHIDRGDVERVADVLGRAFDDDPVMNFIAKQDQHRSRRIRRMMEVALTQMTLPFGECYVAEGYEGAALWNPPGGRPQGIVNDLKLLRHIVPVVGFTRLRRVLGTLNMLEGRHPDVPHYYLMVLGVEPELQGQGIGTRLMMPILERCDQEGMPAYLENSKEQNLPFYQRNGFEVTEHLELPNGGPPVWLMWRDPA
jgi:ribosomal protein S18 acetylase RimI-like enzyme